MRTWQRLVGRRAQRVALALLLVALGAAGLEAWRLQRIAHWNGLIDGEQTSAEIAGAPPELRFAQAVALAASGSVDAAQSRYGALQGDDALGQAARFNAANLLLRQAIGLRAGPQPGQALAYIELAKEGYRELLRRDPQHWGARYNLERAQRLLPDPEPLEEAPPDARQRAERAPTTMRGYSPGLP